MKYGLPLVTLYLTERCNSRCVTCDYWRHGRKDVSLESVRRLVPQLGELGTRTVLISGGEPLLHPEWEDIARLLRGAGMKLWLLTSGLSLAKHARRAAPLFESITVSLDGTCAETYAAIRGLDAFDKVCEGIRAAAATGVAVGLRVTLQRANYRELPRFVSLAHELGASQVSFLAVDVSNPHAFARVDDVSKGLALETADVEEFGRRLVDLTKACAADFHSHFIAESPARLARLRDYFAALCGAGPFPPVLCNAPEFSAVVSVDGRVSPCFFIAGPESTRGQALAEALDSVPMTELRRAIRADERPECRRCVCYMYRDRTELAAGFSLEAAHA